MTTPFTYTDRNGRTVTGTPTNASNVAAWDRSEYVGKDGLESADGNGADAAFISARIPAWHQLGTVLDRGLTAEDVLTTAHLGGWDVQKIELQTVTGLAMPGRFGMTRVNPYTGERELIVSNQRASAATAACVGNGYTPIQMEQILNLLDALRDQTGGEFETAGSLANGSRVFVTCHLPQGMLIGGVDPVDRYLTVLNSHDGTTSLFLLDTPIRTVCRNTAAAAMRNFQSRTALRHTANATKAVAEIRDALGITFAYDEAFEAEAERMIQKAMTEAQFIRSIRKIWPEPTGSDASPRAVTTHRQRELQLVQLFTGSETNTEIRGTNWAGYNAVTELIDWYGGTKSSTSESRAARTVAPGGQSEKTKELAFAAMRVPA